MNIYCLTLDIYHDQQVLYYHWGRDLIEFVTTPATFPSVSTHVAQAGPLLKAKRLCMHGYSTPSQVEKNGLSLGYFINRIYTNSCWTAGS